MLCCAVLIHQWGYFDLVDGPLEKKQEHIFAAAVSNRIFMYIALVDECLLGVYGHMLFDGTEIYVGSSILQIWSWNI
jgi:hypothetical protein